MQTFTEITLCAVLLAFGLASIQVHTNGVAKTARADDDRRVLSELNRKFINNFLTQDAKAHSEIIHSDFVCIESNGAIVSRETYLKNWATDYANSGYTTFRYAEEFIRLFGNMALVRAKTIYTKNDAGRSVEGYTIYTDTYLKENGKWKCVQVQITPVK